MNESSVFRLRIGDLIHAVVKNKKMIILLTLAGLVIGMAMSALSYLRGELAKQYLLTASAAVSNQTVNNRYPGSDNVYPRSEDINVSTGLVDSAIYVLTSDRNLSSVIEKSGLLGITISNISSNLEIKQYNDTCIIEASLYWRSAEEGADILKMVFERGNVLLQETLAIGRVTPINEPTAKYLVGGNLNATMWVYMTFLGLIAGVVISVLRFLIQPTLTNVRDAESLFGLETMAVLEKDNAFFTRRGDQLINSKSEGEAADEFSSAAHILHNRLGGEHKCVYFTSASDEEGKTAVTANMGLALADLGYRVLLVDFDFHNPGLGTMFLNKVEYDHSFNALYHGDISKTEAINPINGYLDLLPAIVERRSVVMDENTISTVKQLADNYDYVLMDTPPVGMAAETMSLNQVADSVVFVIRYDFATIASIREALDRLDKSGSRVVGCMINGTTPRKENRGGKENAFSGRNERG